MAKIGAILRLRRVEHSQTVAHLIAQFAYYSDSSSVSDIITITITWSDGNDNGNEHLIAQVAYYSDSSSVSNKKRVKVTD